jgi:hypothetical protein
VVHYAGVPVVVTDPDESIEGWVPTDDGAFVVGEPQASPGWYPVNDNPHDKATYTFRSPSQGGLTVMANGLPVYVAVDPKLPAVPVLRKLPAIVRFYSSIYGPYPFDAVGAVAARGVRHLVGVDLERAPGSGVGPPDLQEALPDAGAGHGARWRPLQPLGRGLAQDVGAA